MTHIAIEQSGKVLSLAADRGPPHRFHALWLRDNAADAKTRAANGQKLITIGDIPAETTIASAELAGDQVDLRFLPEDRVLRFDLGWLSRHAYDTATPPARGWTGAEVTPWTATLPGGGPMAEFAALTSGGDALRDWLGGVVRYGFGRITGGPVEEGALFRVVDLFGHVRATNYGHHFEVRTEVNPTNLAFTSLGLQAHTDNPYRDPLPSVQVLYCLESSAEGGENMVVDGFAAAQRLRDEAPELFDVLADHCARFEYSGEDGVCLTARRPMIELAPDGEIVAVRFNNRSLAAVTDVPFDRMELWYSAYRRLAEIIDDPAMEIVFRLDPGDSFVVDNTRVLHARKGYSGLGSRWLQGCYADMDGLRSTYHAMLRAEEGQAR